MKLLTEYLDRVMQLDELAANESDPKLKAQLQEEANAYRKLAARRAERYGLAAPPSAEQTE